MSESTVVRNLLNTPKDVLHKNEAKSGIQLCHEKDGKLIIDHLRIYCPRRKKKTRTCSRFQFLVFALQLGHLTLQVLHFGLVRVLSDVQVHLTHEVPATTQEMNLLTYELMMMNQLN